MTSSPSPDQTSPEASRLCEEGYVLLEGRRFEEARARLLRAAELAPGDPLVHYRLGLLFSDTGELGRALAALDRALALQPDNARAHNNRGSILHQMSRLDEAEEAYRRALDLDPRLEQAYLNLGDIFERRGRRSDAIATYQRALQLGLDRGLFEHHLAAAAGRRTERAPESWVRKTFDYFAPTFDQALRTLGYTAPAQLASLLFAHESRQTLDILDLGCGTGECGVALRECKGYLVGIDLSDRMLALAGARGAYDELHATEIHAWLGACAAARFDVVVAADVLIYIGDVDDLFTQVRRVLRSGGWFAFSTEECASESFTLLPTGRYAQSEAYIRMLARDDLAAVEARPVTLRSEEGRPIAGRLYLLNKR